MQKIFIKANIEKTKKKRNALIVYILFFAIFFLQISGTEGAINKQINYQGKLTTSANIAVSNGTYNMEFKLYDSGNSVVWTETRTGGNRVQVTSGLFSVMLGEVTALTSVNFNQTLTLGVNIGGTSVTPTWDGEMSPRKTLGSVPSAVEAERLGGFLPSQTPTGSEIPVLSGGVLTISGSINSPTFVGGTTSTSPLTLRSTTGVGTTGADIIFQTGNNGATEAMRILNNGNVGIGTNNPTHKLEVGGDLFFTTGANRTISVLSGTTQADLNLTVQAGKQLFGSDVGGSLFLKGGETVSGSSGGDVYIEGGFTPSSGNPGGSVYINGGNGDMYGNIYLGNTYGNVSVGSTTATSLFNVGTSGQFRINDTGAIVASTGYNQGSGRMSLTSANTTQTGTSSAFAGNFNSLTTGTGMNLASSTLSSGSLVNLAVTGTAATGSTQKVLNITNSGANSNSTQTTYGGSFANTRTGTDSTNIGSYSTASGGTNNYAIYASTAGASAMSYGGHFSSTATGGINYGIYATASGGTTNYAAIFANGNVGVGTTTPTALLHLKAGTAAVGTAPLKLTAGTNLTTPEAGAVEWDGTNLFVTQTTGPTRKTLAYTTDITPANWDTIGDPTGNGAIAMGSTVQTMDWGTATTQNALSMTGGALTTGKLLSLSSNTLTSGTLLDITSGGTGALTNQKGINVALSGTNATSDQTTYGGYFSNTHAGDTSTNVGLYASATGGTTANYAAQFNGDLQFTNAANRTISVADGIGAGKSLTIKAGDDSDDFSGGGALLFAGGSSDMGAGGSVYLNGGTGMPLGNIYLGNTAGNVSVGSTTATSLFNVGISAQFQVNSTGAIVASTGYTQGSGTMSLTSANTTQTTTSSAFRGNFNSLTTGTGMYLASSSLTSGTLLDITSAGTGALTNQKGINVALSGTNATSDQTTYGGYFSNAHAGTTSTNVGLYASATGGTTANYAAQLNGDLSFTTGANRTISVLSGTTQNDLNLTIKAGDNTGVISSDGGHLYFKSGEGFDYGGNVYIDTGMGGGAYGDIYLANSGGSVNMGSHLRIGADVNLSRSTANVLSLASGDSLNIVSGSLQVAFTEVVTSGRIIRGADGTVGAPAFTFSADTDNGMWRPTTNQIAFSTAGAERLRIDATGDVGIGQTTPTAFLHIKAGTATAGTAPLKFTAGTNLTTPEAGAMEWDGTNLFVTQTTGPTRKTIAYTTDITSQVYPSAGIANSTGSAWGTSYTTTGSGTVLALATTPTFTTNITTPLVLGGTSTTQDLTFQTTSGVGLPGADMHFLVGNNGAIEAMTILNNGYIGIGTNNPKNRLHFATNDANPWVSTAAGKNVTNGEMLIHNESDTGSGEWSGIYLKVGAQAAARIATVKTGTLFASDIVFSATREYDNQLYERMRIEGDSGNVGIGTTNPGEKIEVVGNIYINNSGGYLKFFNGFKFTDGAGAVTVSDSTGSPIMVFDEL